MGYESSRLNVRMTVWEENRLRNPHIGKLGESSGKGNVLMCRQP